MSTKIEWAQEVWNPVTGCTKISEGCRHCYAERMSKRLAGRCGYPPDNPFSVTLHHNRVDRPLHWEKPRRVFVCSMGDLFHDEVPSEFIEQVWTTFIKSPQHQFLVLTKRPKRMLEWITKDRGAVEFPTMSNVWLGVSAEDQKTADERIPLLLQIPAAIRFVSCEPTLGPINLMCVGCPIVGKNHDGASGINSLRYRNPCTNKKSGLDWVICGGESGPRARPIHPDWVRSLRDQCKSGGVPFFFKQWGEWLPVGQVGPIPSSGFMRSCCAGDGTSNEPYSWRKTGKHAAGNILDGKLWLQIPLACDKKQKGL